MQQPGKNLQLCLILFVFLTSRIIIHFAGINLNPDDLRSYWQYLDTHTLLHNLLSGLLYDHAQPPVFNLLMGLILKTGCELSGLLFPAILKLITLINSWLIWRILKSTTSVSFIPLLSALVYVVSPATIAFENELFYTSFVSLLLLTAVYYLIRFDGSGRFIYISGFTGALVILCLTRSLYHMSWYLVITVIIVYVYRRKKHVKQCLMALTAGLLLIACWYSKNLIIFHHFTASTWTGMNLARNVFHDVKITDSNRIEAFEPFSAMPVYRKFVNPEYEKQFHSLNDRDLLRDYKNGSFINEREVSYIQVSELYMRASVKEIHSRPFAFLMNVIQSSIIYFAPATIYSLGLQRVAKMKYYDLIYSANLTGLANGKQQRRILLTISALPKALIYIFVFGSMLRRSRKRKKIEVWNLFILVTITFAFLTSCIFEHYENMRFRFETEPIFMLLAAQVFSSVIRWPVKVEAQPPSFI